MSRIQTNVTFFSIAVLLTFIVMYIQFSYTAMGQTGAMIAATFMAGLTIVLGLMAYAIQHHRNKVAFAAKKKSADEMDTHQVRTIEIDLPLEQAFDLALDALYALDNENIPRTRTGIPSKQILKIHRADRDIGRIEAGLRARTIGIQDVVDFSRIDIQLQRLDHMTTRLQIESRPTNPLETYDLARHMHYVNALALYLREESQSTAAIANLIDDETMDSDLNSDNTRSNHEDQA